MEFAIVIGLLFAVVLLLVWATRKGRGASLALPVSPSVHADQGSLEADLHAAVRDVGGVRILDLSGPLSYYTRGTMDEMLPRLYSGGGDKLLLNLRGVTVVGATGIGWLVRCFVVARNQGVKLKLCEPNARLASVLSTTRLDTVYEIYPGEDEAVASFAVSSSAQLSAARDKVESGRNAMEESQLHIQVREVEDVIILELLGRLVQESAPLLHERISQLMADGKKWILVNMEGVHAFDATGLGEMINAYMRARAVGGDLKVLRPSKLVLAQDDHPGHFFGAHLAVFQNEDEALTSFCKDDSKGKAA